MKAFAQIPNASFENLDSTGTIQNWIYTDIISVGIGDSFLVDSFLIGKSINAHSGMYAMELRNVYNYTTNVPIMNGGVTATLPDTTLYQGFNAMLPLSAKPYSFNFYYKFAQNPFNDSCIGIIKIYNSDNEEIGKGSTIFWDINTNYQFKNVAINYYPTSAIAIGDTIPAFYKIDFKNKVTTTIPHVGQRTLIDDVSLNFTPLNVSFIKENYHSFVYPNPVKDFLKIIGENITNVEILNSIGEILVSSQNSEFDISLFSKGIYFLKIYHAKNVESRKFIKY